MYNKPALLDKYFLKQLFQQTNQEIFIKIISLDFNENPREEIQGKISSLGSINIDGSSAVRRTCQFQMITERIDFTDYYWTTDSKFKLELGLSNNINETYDNTIWFPQGVFILTSFNQQLTTNSCLLSIQGKDKMCLLNGEVSGQISAQVDFASEDIKDDLTGEIIQTESVLLFDIIKNLLIVYGQEKLENIIINDVDSIGLEMITYQGTAPLYLFRNIMTGIVENVSLNANQKIYLYSNGIQTTIQDGNIEFFSLSPFYNNNNTATKVRLNNNSSIYQIIKITSGEVAGYRETPLIYPEKTLIAAAGETVTSVLDKIVKTFTDYEYFYDVYGRFVFQKKKTYANSFWSPVIDNSYINILSENNEYVYSFDNNELTIGFTNTPNIMNIKNDFTVNGTRKTAEGAEINTKLRIAINNKPKRYERTGLDGIDGIFEAKYDCDWRELIYQMADDYFHNISKGQLFYNAIAKKNPEFFNGITGYEQYYTDIYAFWRDLYDPVSKWKIEILNAPETMNFWLDFIEGDQLLNRQHPKKIGSRTKVVNDSKATAISFRDTVPVIFTNDITKINNSLIDSYTYIQLPTNLESLFTIAPAQKSLQNEMDKVLYEYLFATETISFEGLPVYVLEPNTKILIQDAENNIFGQYLVNKITLPVEYNGKMTIAAIKDIERIY